MKTCPKCQQELSEENFAFRAKSKDGKQTYCKKCVAAIMIERYHQNPSTFQKSNTALRDKVSCKINEIKASQGCFFCSEKEPVCLDFHHITDNKEKDVSYWVRAKSLTKALKEIKECLCVCSNCHRKIHAGLLSVPKLI